MKYINRFFLSLFFMFLLSCNGNNTSINNVNAKNEPEKITTEIRNSTQIELENFLDVNRKKFKEIEYDNELKLVEEKNNYEKELFNLINKTKIDNFVGIVSELSVDETNEYLHFNHKNGMHLTFKIITVTNKVEQENVQNQMYSTTFMCDYVLNKNSVNNDKFAKIFKTIEEGDTVTFSGSILTEDKRVLYVTFNGCFASNMDYVIQNDGYVGNELGLIYSPLFAFDIKQIQKHNTK